MRKFKFVLLAMLFVAGSATASVQQEENGKAPVGKKFSSIELVKAVYPKASKLKKVNEYWYRVVDAKGKTLGFAMDGTPYCKTVKGFAGPTPMMVVTDKAGTIKKVSLMKNNETKPYVAKLTKKGFFDQWNGKKLKAAASQQVDGFTGATYTGKAVKQNMEYLLKNGTSKFPKK